MVRRKETREWLRELADCEKVVPDEEVEALGSISRWVENAEDNATSGDEVDEDLEAECQRLNSVLELPADTYSLTRIHPNLPDCMKYGVHSGRAHMYMDKFSPFSRGLQGAAIAVAAYATTGLLKARCWNEPVIDQIIEDGDTYYCESYRQLGSHDRRLYTVLDLKQSLNIQKTHQVHLIVEDAAYSGLFHPESPTELHLVKALELFFRTCNAGVLTSSELDISIWREGKYFHIFDAQPRRDDLSPDESRGSAKLILLHDLAGVVFIILEKSNVHNGHFVLYPLHIGGITKAAETNLEDHEKCIEPPRRRPSGYMLQGKRALVRSSFHLWHGNVPLVLQGRAHLIVALVALIYSRLIHANKWTTAILDLIFNQAHIYLVDLARVLEKKIDNDLELMIDDVLGDIILGVYSAKVKVHSNIIPGQVKKGKGKGKTTLNSGLADFFKDYQSGILEIKKTFYAIWKDNDKFYFLDPFACDSEGFRVDPVDPETVSRYRDAVACITMNSTIDEVVETILENTGNTEKDPFFIHGVQVLYVKAEDEYGGSSVIYRESKTNRRPLPPTPPAPEPEDECKRQVDTVPKPRANADRCKEEGSQFPELMRDVADYVIKDDRSYEIVNPRRLILHGSKNCHAEEFNETWRGHQGLAMALSAMFYGRIKHPSQWRNSDVDKVIDLGDVMHPNLARSAEGESFDEQSDDDEDETDDVEDEEEEEEDEEEEEEDKETSTIPSRIKYGDNFVNLTAKMGIVTGDAEPIVNLGEALDRYFMKYYEVILENKRMMFAIWNENGYYFLFNPYGSDEEGWRLREYPASLVVSDTINELVDILYSILEFNDRHFDLHFVHIKSIQPEKYVATIEIEAPESLVEKYETAFLPLTDEDISRLSPEQLMEKLEDTATEEEESEEDTEEVSDEEEAMNLEDRHETEREDQTERDPLTEVLDQEHRNTPSQMNLFLVTTNVNLEDEILDPNAKEALEYERLKYNHPPPYILPPKNVLLTLLEAKKAAKSVPSLVSSFSIDSKLAVHSDLPGLDTSDAPTINAINGAEVSKIIKLPPKKYLFSRVSPIGFTPLRAIDEKYIHDEEDDNKQEQECRKQKLKPLGIYHRTEIPEESDVRISPTILPLGPLIKTPATVKKPKPCVETKTRQCKLHDIDRANEMLDKLICNTEDVVLEMLFPKTQEVIEDFSRFEVREDSFDMVVQEMFSDEMLSDYEDLNEQEELEREIKSQRVELPPEVPGFSEIDDNAGIISGNMKLEDNLVERFHFNSSFFAAILCILAKTQKEVHEFTSRTLDSLVYFADKIYSRIGSLTLKAQRTFNNLELFGVKFNIILKQNVYADPENYEPDILERTLAMFLNKHSTGILVFEQASYAFWVSNNRYYLFDPYACDESGNVSEDGTSCLLQYVGISALIQRFQQHSRIDANKPYRIYILFIAHIEALPKTKKYKEKLTNTDKEVSDDDENEEIGLEDEFVKALTPQLDKSLIELSDWIKDKSRAPDLTLPGFTALRNVNASAQEVIVVENDITRPILAPFKHVPKDPQSFDLPRKKLFDRNFNEHSIIAEPLDLCIMAWSCIHNPTSWGSKTVRGIYEASQDLAFDSLLAAEDTTVGNMIDGLLTEFDIANYRFLTVFAPLHAGKLYATEGWNLAMSLRKIVDTPIYTGAVLSCGKAHIGIMKCGLNLFAWWGVTGTKNLRIVTSENMEDFLKLIVQAIDEPGEVEFQMRVITISYARKLDPDCSDIEGLHELAVSNSLPQIHRKEAPLYDLESLYHRTTMDSKPLFILGSVGLQDSDAIKEPKVKRCYFIAILAVMVKRDIMQSLLPSIIDKIIEVGENLYREFDDPNYHTEHILRNVTVMNRIFDFRDVASSLHVFKEDNDEEEFCSLLKNELNKFFKHHSHGILQFTNCCYAFWCCQDPDAYYCLDPYQSDKRGRRAPKGSGYLGIFPSLGQMVKAMSINRAPKTTGFFIHKIHIESINVVPAEKFQEDPMWIYLDYHWAASHASKSKTKKRRKKRKATDFPSEDSVKEEFDKPSWNHYTIEIPNLIYSIWGTVGSYDTRFGQRVGKNQAAICVAALAMQFLCHPSKWSPATLDSAVICGDCYYTESIKAALRQGVKHSNIFNLEPCFRVFPHIWTVEFGAKMCGMIYGGTERSPLAVTLKLALARSSNVLIKLEGITLAVLFANDGYYAVDPCWSGPPLFPRHRGAVYALRCRNVNALVYVLTKMINSNQRLEFTVTPIEFIFKHEVCVSSDQRNKPMKKKILIDPVESKPGVAVGPSVPVAGAITAPDADIYLKYRKNVELGIECGEVFADPPMPSPEPLLDDEAFRNMRLSTNWHKYLGRVNKSRGRSIIPASSIQQFPRECYDFAPVTRPADQMPSFSRLLACDDYPRTVDFVDDKFIKTSTKQLTQRNIAKENPPNKPLDCLPPRKFILNRSKREFKKQITEMAGKSYKIYKHRVPTNDEALENEGEEIED